MKRYNIDLKGLEEVERNLNKEIKNIRINSTKALIEVAILIRRKQDKDIPKVPVKTGNLRASLITPIIDTPRGVLLKIEYTARYAPFVHIKKDADTNWTRAGSGERWFERMIKNSIFDIKNILLKHGKLKK